MGHLAPSSRPLRTRSGLRRRGTSRPGASRALYGQAARQPESSESAARGSEGIGRATGKAARGIGAGAPRQPGAGADHDSERWRLKALLIGTHRACRSADAAQLHPHTPRDFHHHAHRRLSAVLANSKLLGGHQITAGCGSAATATGALTRYSCHVGRTSRSCSAPLRCVLLNAP